MFSTGNSEVNGVVYDGVSTGGSGVSMAYGVSVSTVGTGVWKIFMWCLWFDGDWFSTVKSGGVVLMESLRPGVAMLCGEIISTV